MEIYIIRHGETLWNESKRLQGKHDTVLNDSGRALAKETGESISDIDFDLFFSSPLQRAYETANLLKGNRDIEIIKDDRLMEISFGHYEGSLFPDLVANDDLTFKYFFSKPELYVAPSDGESFEELINRAGEFMTEMVEPLEKQGIKRIMIVAHGTLNKAIMSYIKKHPTSMFWSGGLQPNCNIIIVDYSDGKYSIISEAKSFLDKNYSV